MSARRMWALDGAHITMDRTELVDGAEPGRITFPAPSFLVEHDEGLVLFDTGVTPAAAPEPARAFGDTGPEISYDVSQRVDRQLELLGVATSDVTHVVLSHAHFDHTGGVPLFSQARFLVGRGELPTAFWPGPGLGGAYRHADLDPARRFDWTYLDAEHDLFGDGGLVVLPMPGHTPGNLAMLVRLPRRAILLTGDTAHLREALDRRAPMDADADKDAAVRSLEAVHRIASENDAEVWVGHDPDDWERFGAPGLVGRARIGPGVPASDADARPREGHSARSVWRSDPNPDR